MFEIPKNWIFFSYLSIMSSKGNNMQIGNIIWPSTDLSGIPQTNDVGFSAIVQDRMWSATQL